MRDAQSRSAWNVNPPWSLLDVSRKDVIATLCGVLMTCVGRLALNESIIQNSGDPALTASSQTCCPRPARWPPTPYLAVRWAASLGTGRAASNAMAPPRKESPSQSLMNWTSDLVCLVDHGEPVKFLEIIFDIMNAVACRSCSKELVPGLVETHFGRRGGASDLADKAPGKICSFVWRCRNTHKPGDPMLDPDCATGEISRKRTPYQHHAGGGNVRADHQPVDHRGE